MGRPKLPAGKAKGDGGKLNIRLEQGEGAAIDALARARELPSRTLYIRALVTLDGKGAVDWSRVAAELEQWRGHEDKRAHVARAPRIRNLPASSAGTVPASTSPDRRADVYERGAAIEYKSIGGEWERGWYQRVAKAGSHSWVGTAHIIADLHGTEYTVPADHLRRRRGTKGARK